MDPSGTEPEAYGHGGPTMSGCAVVRGRWYVPRRVTFVDLGPQVCKRNHSPEGERLVAMEPSTIAAFALELPEVTEEQPFGPEVDVYKVAAKVFLLIAPESAPPTISVKCEPDLAIELRAEYEAVIPGYHLNKKHWNTVILDGTIPDDEIEEMVSHSYERVVAGLPKAMRQRLVPTD